MNRLGTFLLVLGLVLPAAPGQAADRADDVAAVVKGNNQAALDLYAQLRGQQSNLFFAPSSISAALGMTCAGARGETAEEMARALHFPLGVDRLAHAFGALHRQGAEGKKRGYELSTANALWAQKGEAFRREFLETVRTDFGAGLKIGRAHV